MDDAWKWLWVCFSYPHVSIFVFSTRPLKWSLLHGQEGILFTQPDSPTMSDIDMSSTAQNFLARTRTQMVSRCLYLLDWLGVHVFVILSAPLKLVDSSSVDDRMTSTESTESRAVFGISVVHRDRTCMVTNAWVGYCIGCHIIPEARRVTYPFSYLNSSTFLLNDPMGQTPLMTSMTSITESFCTVLILYLSFGDGELNGSLSSHLVCVGEE